MPDLSLTSLERQFLLAILHLNFCTEMGIFQQLLQNNFPQMAQQPKIYSHILTTSGCCQHTVLLPPVP